MHPRSKPPDAGTEQLERLCRSRLNIQLICLDRGTGDSSPQSSIDLAAIHTTVTLELRFRIRMIEPIAEWGV